LFMMAPVAQVDAAIGVLHQEVVLHVQRAAGAADGVVLRAGDDAPLDGERGALVVDHALMARIRDDAVLDNALGSRPVADRVLEAIEPAVVHRRLGEPVDVNRHRRALVVPQRLEPAVADQSVAVLHHQGKRALRPPAGRQLPTDRHVLDGHLSLSLRIDHDRRSIRRHFKDTFLLRLPSQHQRLGDLYRLRVPALRDHHSTARLGFIEQPLQCVL
jgi:hypothetical protein